MIIALVIAVVLVAGALAGLYGAYHKTFYCPYKGMSETGSPPILSKHPYRAEVDERVSRMVGTPWEFFETTSYDGLKLSARYHKGRDGMPLCIFFHGYRGSAVRDLAGIGTVLIDGGYSILTVDQRAHWRSEGHTLSFGINERFDVLSWIEFAKKRFGEDIPIYLFGISMGGGTVLMASGQKLPKNVKGIVADCPFNSPKDIICYVCGKIGLIPALCWPIVWMSARLYGHFDISATTAAKEVMKTETPILIIHGDGDDFVPAYMSKEVRDANPDMVEYHTIPDAGHGMSFYYDTQGYKRIVKEFMERVYLVASGQ